MKTNLQLFILSCSLFGLSSCASVKPYYADGTDVSAFRFERPASTELEYSLYLTGGVSLDKPASVLNAIEKENSASSDGLVFLGDVLSVDDLPVGVADENNPFFLSIKNLDKNYKDLYLIPGEREWSSDKKTSYAAIQSLDHLLKDIKAKGRFIAPRKGCGTPEVVRLSDHAVLVLVDSQWAIDAEGRKGEKIPGCELASVLELKTSIKDIIQSHSGDHIIFAVHHPIYANGPTAGNYPLTSHLLPVPVLGSIITGIKSLVSSDQ